MTSWPKTHRDYIKERRLFGDTTCRIGECGQDGTVIVAAACVSYDGPGHNARFHHVDLIRCEKHAVEMVDKSRRKKPRKAKGKT